MEEPSETVSPDPVRVRYCHIVAVSEKRYIGRNGKLPWRVPSDLERFSKMTAGSTVIYGSRTYFRCLGAKALPDRYNIIMSRKDLVLHDPDVIHVRNLEQAIRMANGLVAGSGKTNAKIWFIGGAQIYRQTLTMIDEIHMTVIMDNGIIEGDRKYPFVPPPWGRMPSNWVEEYRRKCYRHSRDRYRTTVVMMTRKRPCLCILPVQPEDSDRQ